MADIKIQEEKSNKGLVNWFIQRNLKSKFMLVLIPVIVLSLAVITASGIISLNRSVNTTLEKSLTETASLASKRVSDNLEIYKQLTIEISQWVAMFDENKITEAVLTEVAARNDFIDVSRIYANGTSIKGIDHSSDAYFTIPREDDSAYISDVFHSAESDKDVIIISSAVIRNEKFDGVLTVMLDASLLSELVKGVVIGDSGNAFIIDDSKTCIAHTDATLVGKNSDYVNDLLRQDSHYQSLLNLWDEMQQGQAGYLDYDYINGYRYAAFAPITGTNNWSVAITVASEEFLGQATNAAIISIVISAFFLVLIILVVIFFINNITRQIGNATRRVELLAAGDLSTPVEQPKTNDEIGRLIIATKSMVDELSGIINEVKYVLNEMVHGNLQVKFQRECPGDLAEIRTAIEYNLQAISDLIIKISRASNEVARGSAQMASGAASLSQGASEQASSIEELFTTISDITQRASDIAAIDANEDEQVFDDADETISSAELAEHKAKTAKTTMDKLIVAMERIAENSKQIKKITYNVESISTETNILALNASVEAAHAGDAGKGFGVIAAEVRQLAVKSKEAVNVANQQTERIMRAVDRGGRMVEDTVESVSSIVIALEQIKAALSQISNVIESTAATAEETAAASEELSAQADLLREIIAQFQHSGENEYQ